MAAPVGDAGEPVGEHSSGDLHDRVTGRREQVLLAAALFDDEGLSADLLEHPVEGVQLFADAGVFPVQQPRGR